MARLAALFALRQTGVNAMSHLAGSMAERKTELLHVCSILFATEGSHSVACGF
jgi:hypothetical protein